MSLSSDRVLSAVSTSRRSNASSLSCAQFKRVFGTPSLTPAQACP
jgi:hypothetical protein